MRALGWAVILRLQRKMRRQNGKKLRGLWLSGQRMPDQRFQQLRICIPDNGNRGTDVAFHIFPGSRIMPCHFRVQPFCHQMQTFRLPGSQIHSVSGVQEACVVCRKAKPVQKRADIGKLGDVLRPPPYVPARLPACGIPLASLLLLPRSA